MSKPSKSAVRLDGVQVGYIPAARLKTALVELGATGGYRWENNVIVATPMLKYRSTLVRILNRLVV
ncbi:hypothetical protein GCM10027275_25180 [Rhabdobacter roseus]|uniref:Uncharacterized protein n=1 Tax=Rhabdobacter roseus TaxID=1655419 RepID=A0A840TWA4_9BACT|nr:hypothetical protein [Rhabdobacter roseus]MBB5284458.1 hypothetical protein [Rhabdobacter roseus]